MQTSPGTLGTTSGVGAAGAGLGTTPAASGLSAGTYGKVIVTLKSAHDLLDKTWIGKADPYCVVKVADAEIQTHHVKNAGDHAVWEESFAFNNVAPDDVIEFNVYDHNRLMKDSLMGTGSLSMRQVFTEGRLEVRVPLTSRTGTKEAGEIWVSLRCDEGMGGAGYGAGAGAASTATTAGTTTTAGLAGAAAGLEGTRATERYGTEERYERERYGTAGYDTGTTTAAGTTGLEGAMRATTLEEARGTTTAGTVGAATTTVGMGGAVQTGREAVCGREYFTKVEDRPVVKERVTVLREHRPVEKEYVVETRATGVERGMPGEAEHMGAQDRVVSVAQPAPEERGTEYFTKVEDRPAVKERVTLMKEHRPVEREYVTETRATGVERGMPGEAEHMGAQDRVVSVAQPGPEERSTEFFTKTEDRPVVKERVTTLKEHVPYEKEYVVETRATGVEREAAEGRVQEHMGAQDRIVSVAEPGHPCD